MVGDNGYGLMDPNRFNNTGFGSSPAPSSPQQNSMPQLSREEYRDKWMSSGTRDQAGLSNFLNQYGGTQLSGNGTVKTPYGDDVIDMLIGARSGGNGMPGWTGLPSQSASSVTPWDGSNPGNSGSGQQQGNNMDWMKWIQSLFGGNNGQPMLRAQDMQYNRNPQQQQGGALSNYFTNRTNMQPQQAMF